LTEDLVASLLRLKRIGNSDLRNVLFYVAKTGAKYAKYVSDEERLHFFAERLDYWSDRYRSLERIYALIALFELFQEDVINERIQHV